jgi:hypothetical protein
MLKGYTVPNLPSSVAHWRRARMLTIMGAIYEAPAIVALGPTRSAVAAGFAVVWFGEVYLTSAGEMYLQSIRGNQ